MDKVTQRLLQGNNPKWLLILLITLIGLMSPLACAPQRKPAIYPPKLPPNTNRAPIFHDPQRVAEGLAGTAQQTPGMRRVWGVGYDNTVLLGAILDSKLSADEIKKTKIAAVNRALRSTTQLVVIKITDQADQVQQIQGMRQKLQHGTKLEEMRTELQGLSAKIPAVDPVRPR